MLSSFESLISADQTLLPTIFNIIDKKHFTLNVKSFQHIAPNFRWLNVSANKLQWFDYAFIPKQLEWIDLHQVSSSLLLGAIVLIGMKYEL